MRFARLKAQFDPDGAAKSYKGLDGSGRKYARKRKKCGKEVMECGGKFVGEEVDDEEVGLMKEESWDEGLGGRGGKWVW